jgi:hypothetical protein
MVATEGTPAKAVKTTFRVCSACRQTLAESAFGTFPDGKPKRVCGPCAARLRERKRKDRAKAAVASVCGIARRSHANQRGEAFTAMAVLSHCPEAMDELPAYFAALPPINVYRHGNMCIIETMSRTKFTIADYVRASSAWHCLGRAPTMEKEKARGPLLKRPGESFMGMAQRVGQPEHLLAWAVKERPADPLSLLKEVMSGPISLVF